MKTMEAGKLIALWCVLWTCSPPGLAEDAAADLKPPVLRDVMWQVLPDRIQSVTVGLDGRVWWAARAATCGSANCGARSAMI
jgi:hypothetical protein